MDNLLGKFQEFEINKINMDFLKGGKDIKSYEILKVGTKKNFAREWVTYIIADIYYDDGTKECEKYFSDVVNVWNPD